jgi:hypothetical protein
LRKGLLSLAVFGALVMPSTAAGARWDAGGKAPIAVLAGSGVSWLSRTSGDGYALYDARVGHLPRRVQVYHSPCCAFAGSSSGVVLESEGIIDGAPGDGQSSSGTELFAGGIGEPLTSLVACNFGVSTGLGRIDVSGSTIAFERCDQTIEVRSLDGTQATRTVGSDVHAVRLAGRYVAWLEGTYNLGSANSDADLVVYDLGREVEAYRIPDALLPSEISGFALQADGKVAFTFDPSANDTNPRELVGWASPAEPRVHKLPLPRRYSYTLNFAHNRIVFARDSKAAKRPLEETGVTDLKGHVRLIQRHAVGTGIDYDGEHIAYAIRACHRYVVVRQLLSARARQSTPCRKR